MSTSPDDFNTLINRFLETLPPGLESFKKDLEQHASATLKHGLKKLDLVTREEFDTQRRVLQKTRRMLEMLNRRLDELESKPNNIPSKSSRTSHPLSKPKYQPRSRKPKHS
ncbi:MAG: hypothetical protein CMF51_05490 [Legionellales bacterium]|nr:hypothetical protein [Legionellales bacterium]|tara:strand:+ start:290 stop:622 length:333 start_codon:yes stop_codon:yes gene_type:complete